MKRPSVDDGGRWEVENFAAAAVVKGTFVLCTGKGCQVLDEGTPWSSQNHRTIQ